MSVHRPAEAVFAYLADGTNNRRWRDGVLKIERVLGDGGVGTTYRQVLRGPTGRPVDGDYRVTAYEPPRLLAFEVVASYELLRTRSWRPGRSTPIRTCR